MKKLLREIGIALILIVALLAANDLLIRWG